MPPLSNQDYRTLAATVKRVQEMPRRQDSLPRGIPPSTVPFYFRRFELKDDLIADDTTAEAYLLKRDYDADSDTYRQLSIDVHEVFDVWSFTGFTGEGKTDTADGTRGLCVHLHDVDKWEIVSMDSGVKFAKLNGTLNAGSYYAATIWAGDPLDETEEEVDAYDWFLETGYKLESGAKVMLTLMSGKWYVTMSDTCPVAQ